MTFSPAFLDELRSRVGLVQVVQRRVKLQKAGREWKGCCPFHNEKTPSFYVNEDKQFYHCFGCGAHGDVIRFVVEQEGLRFPDAVRQLAGECGLEVPEDDPRTRQRERERADAYDVLTRASRWFAEQMAGLGGADVRRYLQQERGLTPETIETFGLGYAPPGNKLAAALRDAGEGVLLEAGLIGKTEQHETFDRFRQRLTFPIRDQRGRVVGFGARAIGDIQPKYLNSPDTKLFDKGWQLYNLDRAAPVARRAGRLLLVEGYMDVIALAQAGIAEAVAPLGTAVTEQQLQLMWRVAPEPILCFDGDAAGQKAVVRAIERALPLLEPGRSLRFVTLPAGQDPDDVVRQQGRAAFETMLGRAESLIDRLWRSQIDGVDVGTPERRAAVKAKLREYVGTISHVDIRRLYHAELNKRFDAKFDPRRAPPAAASRPARGRSDTVQAALIAAVIETPALAEAHLEDLSEMPVKSPELREVLGRIISAVGAGGTFSLPYMLGEQMVERIRAHPDATTLRLARQSFPAVLASLVGRKRADDAISAARARYAETGNDEDFAEVQRLVREQATGSMA